MIASKYGQYKRRWVLGKVHMHRSGCWGYISKLERHPTWREEYFNERVGFREGIEIDRVFSILIGIGKFLPSGCYLGCSGSAKKHGSYQGSLSCHERFLLWR